MATLNVTAGDLRRGRYELQKDVLLDRFVRRRSILNDPEPEDGSVPPRFVRSQLLEAMVGAASNQIGVCVVKAGRGLGKTAAAKFVLKNSAGGIMFCNMKGPYYDCYWKGVANELGIPEECYGEDWQDLLVSSVAAATSPPDARKGLKHLIYDFMEGLLSMCGGTEVETGVPLPPTINGLDLTKVQNKPIIVLDDFDNVTDGDITFIQALFPIVFAHRVLLFVMVRNEATANKLLDLNGWGRIGPLKDICHRTPSGEPEWTPIHWTQSQLEEIVLSRYPNIDVESLSEELSQDGANPLDVLIYAEGLV
jgi:hypothetical protein